MSNILVIRLSSLGDILLTTPLLRSLRHRFPLSRISILVKKTYANLAEGMPWVDSCITLLKDKKNYNELRKEIRNCKFETIIDLQNNVLSRRLSRYSQAERIYRFNRPRINRWLRIHFPAIRETLSTPPHNALAYLRSARELNLADDDLGLELLVGQEWSKPARELLFTELPGWSPGQPLIIASPGARHETKRWRTVKWIELLDRLFSKGLTNQVIIGSEQDIPIAKTISTGINHAICDLTGRTSLGVLTGLISNGSVLITNDSGPMHIAAAVSTPVAAIFGPTVTEFGFAPFRCQQEILQVENLSCRPCHPHGPPACPKKHFKCMNQISVEMVYQAVRKLMKLSDSNVEPEFTL